jgi:hypothetical protein
MAPEYVTKEVCDLHHQVTAAKIESLQLCDEKLEKRMDGIEEGIAAVQGLQKQILYVIIFIAIGTIMTLVGVIVGRGFDLGWMVP